jgi:hypothetical protein
VVVLCSIHGFKASDSSSLYDSNDDKDNDTSSFSYGLSSSSTCKGNYFSENFMGRYISYHSSKILLLSPPNSIFPDFLFSDLRVFHLPARTA